MTSLILGLRQDKRLSFHSPKQTTELPQAGEAKEGRVPQGSRTERDPTEKSALGKHPGGKERQGSRKWVSFLSFRSCFSSSCDLEAPRELQGFKTRAECAEEKLPLTPSQACSLVLGGNQTDKDQVGAMLLVLDTAHCSDLHTLEANASEDFSVELSFPGRL